MEKRQIKDETPRARSRMDFKNRLQRQYPAIVEDLDVKYILDELYQNNVLSHSNFNLILNLTNREDQTRFLLDNLIQSGTISSYEAFTDSLAKDYRWLYEKLIENHVPIMDDSFEDSLSKGDVPRPPDHHVRRIEVENRVANKLRELKRHKILVLLGMSGSGKTCVAISTLRENPELITNDFNGVVLWLNLGNCKTNDDIIAQQTKLLRKASSMYNIQNSYMNSSISMSSMGSLADNSLSNLDWTWQDLKDRLKTQFLEQTLKDCLLVLDEVNDRHCLEALDIGCKIMITTRDTGVVANFDAQIIKIENSLQKEESLKIFASCLDVEVSELPRQAKTLHELCKGSPFHIALIGAQLAENKEKLKHKQRHWDYYVKKLEKKEFSIFLPRPNANPMKPIEVCINVLSDNLRQPLKKLAILPDNVKVSPKVLSKLLNKPEPEVSNTMKELKAKSLVIETYDKDQQNYLYEVHDIIMTYLRTCISGEEKCKMHDLFLTSYDYTTNNYPLEILDDGYIAYYVGYHILNTSNWNNKWNLFKKLFLDLRFLGNKVRLTGPADVILDLQKYGNNIAADDFDQSLINNIISYLSTHGTDLYHYKCTDIVQSILQHESQGTTLYARASEVAQINCEKNELYFDFLQEQDSDGIKHSTIDVNEHVTCISYLGNDLIVGTSGGAIKFFHISTNKLKKELLDNETCKGVPVKWIGVAYSKHPPIVAALFADGALKLWYIDDIDVDNEGEIIEEEPEESYNNNVPGLYTIRSKMSPIIKCRWTINEEYLVAQTADMVIVYLPTGDVVNVIDNFERNVKLLCSTPCSNDRYIAVATAGSRKGVDILDLENGKERHISFEDPTPESEYVIDILAVPSSNKIITLKHREVTLHEFKISQSSIKKCNTRKTRAVITSHDINDNIIFLSMAINRTGTLLFVSTDDSRIICVDLKNCSSNKPYLFDLNNMRGNVESMAVSEMLMWDEFVPSSDVLLTGTGTVENSAKVWYLDPPYISSQTSKNNGKVRLTSQFDVSFLHSTSPPSPTSVNSAAESANQTPKRHQSFANHKEAQKVLRSTRSLNKLKPLNLKGICNNSDVSGHPLLAVIDEKNNIQVMRGRKLLTEITENTDDHITGLRITPCNQHIIYGLASGNVKRYTLRTKAVKTIMDLNSPIQYMSFVTNDLLMVAAKNLRVMAYRLMDDGSWMAGILQPGNTHLGSQEILNDIQGVKRKTSQSDGMSDSSSDLSLESKDRMFRSDAKELCKGGGLVKCFYVDNSLITVESNASIKLWDKRLKLACILNARQSDFTVRCAAFRKNVLVICDERNMAFQTFEVQLNSEVNSESKLSLIKEHRFTSGISSCDLTSDGNILAVGLNSGNVVIWNVRSPRQISLLRHHKSKVQSCSFSPVPSRLYGSRGSNVDSASEQPPLVLCTVATEVVWWDLSLKMRINSKTSRPNLNAMTPLASPHEPRSGAPSEDDNDNSSSSSTNFFFADGLLNQHCWKAIWKSKTCKQGSKRKDILSCIKLTGMYTKRLCHDDKFSCFVTVDNTGHIHIMNVIKNLCT